ncbi:MAG: hypothetical protein Q4Q62_06640 [Thermoplasmata archaeon]|nr:hypothetical protein [Thermoplasmata archaeon]
MLFSSLRRKAEPRRDRPRYVSSLQRDVRKYLGWSRQDVEADYSANRSVHTILTIGYMEYVDDILVLTEKGELLMQNVMEQQAPAAE